MYPLKDTKLCPTLCFDRDLAQKMAKNKTITICCFALMMLALIALFSPIIAPYDPNAISLKDSLQPPSSEHIMGTDYLGRDLLSRVLYGTTTSLKVATTVVGTALFVGTMIGCAAGYYGGLVDEIVSRIVDLFLSFPGIIFAMAVVGILGSGVLNLILALALVHWASYARVVRGQVLSVRNQEYVTSAKIVGVSNLRIIIRHVLPNAIAPVIVLATLDMGHVILSASTLSFLGLGIPPSIPEWGSMLNAGKEFMRSAPYMTIFPGMAVTLSVTIFSLLGEGLRDVLDPNREVTNFGST